MSLHSLAGGDLCTEDPVTGCCKECHVSLTNPCDECGGRGYHRGGCKASEDYEPGRVAEHYPLSLGTASTLPAPAMPEGDQDAVLAVVLAEDFAQPDFQDNIVDHGTHVVVEDEDYDS